jgi:sugar phosphate isomerase/epimerase
MKKDIPLISIGFDGYNMLETIEGLSKTNSKNIVLCAIDGFTKHIIPEELSAGDRAGIKKLYKKYNLNFYGLAGHCNISDDDDLDKMVKRMEFTKLMKGRYIDTNAGHKGTESNFYKNIKEVIRIAEKLDIIVCLETHGDLVSSGKTGHELLKSVNSDRIKIGYDPANVYFYSRGMIDPIEDVKYALGDIGIIHFKGISHDKSKLKWDFPVMEKSSFDYDGFFKVLEDCKYNKMIAIEIESKFHFEENIGFSEDATWDKEKIINIYNSEIDYLIHKLFWM